MPDPTTAALLALLERCGDLRPDTLAVAASKSSDELTLCLCIRADGQTVAIPDFPADALHAIAADAIERWMLAQGMRVDVKQWPATDPRGAYTLVDVWTSDHPLVPADAPTKIDALIAAANAVLDRKGAGDAE